MNAGDDHDQHAHHTADVMDATRAEVPRKSCELVKLPQDSDVSITDSTTQYFKLEAQALNCN